eukprot:Em0004g1486a
MLAHKLLVQSWAKDHSLSDCLSTFKCAEPKLSEWCYPHLLALNTLSHGAAKHPPTFTQPDRQYLSKLVEMAVFCIR